MKRQDALNAIRFAGYHGDSAAGARIYIESRVSYTVYLATYRRGQQARRDGRPCGCGECAAMKLEAQS